MDFAWVSVSFWMSLITNVAVFLGVLAIFYWVRGNVTNQFVAKHRTTLQYVISSIYILYIFLESLTNTYLGPHAFGMHWTFLNIVIIACFLFNMILQSKGEFWIFAFSVTAYVLVFAHRYSLRIFILLVIVILLMYWISTHGKYLQEHLLFCNLCFAAFSASALGIISMLYTAPNDIWFWVRQIGALVIIYLCAVIAADALQRQNQEMFRYHDEATIDRLTGVKNMGTFNTDLTKLYKNYRTTGARYRLYELDIDFFKRVNDTYGHPTGNEVLKAVAATLKQIAVAHGHAQVYRMGGEEFGIVMATDDPSKEDATAIGLEINKRIQELSFHAADTDFHITVSIGLEIVVPEDNNYLDIYSKADHYLYQSKHNGRNAMTIDGKTFKMN
ncbi:GGDEF domain-containing protein [Lacticaseibacillus zhaodongensis]|uniref:GGDEF domain-containing protein n=1 Tax=Lacticaseibacillus zhaodongensis TaxID=2668065 RepID=UPI0012D2FE80|nr:GGDEF domain-containing protein [Lacticaseibacillus zhaodongensis]